MKKYGSLILALALMALMGGTALARGNWGGGSGTGYGYSQATPEQQEAFAKFQRDTLQDRQQLAAKKLELRNLYNDANPDQARIQALSNEITDLRASIDKKAIEAGVGSGYRAGYGRGNRMGGGYGQGGGYGRGGGSCWR